MAKNLRQINQPLADILEFLTGSPILLRIGFSKASSKQGEKKKRKEKRRRKKSSRSKEEMSKQ